MQKYTEEDLAKIREIYLASPNAEGVKAAAAAVGKSTKSIIGKLVVMEIYVPKNRTKTSVTKEELLEGISECLDIPSIELEELLKCSKVFLMFLYKQIS